MPKRDKYVSLWLGEADSAASLDEYLRIDFTEDGDTIPSSFAKDFRIKTYEDDFREARTFDIPLHSTRELLARFSYHDVIIPKFVRIIGEYLPPNVTAVILLYNFEYTEGCKEIANALIRMRFIGTVTLE